MQRIPPSVRMREGVEQLLRGDAGDDAPPEAPMRGSVRSLGPLHPAGVHGGRGHGLLGPGARPREPAAGGGWRNGDEPKGVQTEAGLLGLAVPQLRATEGRFRPRLGERLGRRSVDLEGSVRGMDVRGLSPQDGEEL